MKKTLVAIAALAAFGAQAQSTVTMSGIMDAGYQSISNFGGQKTNQVGQSGARTTTVKLNGTEDLGAGMSANFQFEVQPSIIAGDGNKYNAAQVPAYTAITNATAINAAQVTGQASAQSGLVGKGQNFIGLTDAKLGTVQFGTINTATFGAYAAVSGLGTGVGSGYGSGNTFGDFTRVESAVAYKSPSFNGVDFSVLRGTDNQAVWGVAGSTGTSIVLRRPQVTDMGIGYANGPFAVKFGRLESKATANESTATNVNATTTTQLLGGSYDAGFAKFAAATGTVKNKGAALTTNIDNKLQVLSVTVPYGVNRFIAQQGTHKAEGTSVSYNTGKTSKSTGIAFERDLSKRTFVYARYEKTDLGAFNAGAYIINGAAGAANVTAAQAWTADSTRKVTTVGISHAF